MTLAAGSRLGPYEILSPLGAGGMGEVYRAKDTRLDRIVAIKVLPPHLSQSAEVRQRFEREAKSISSLSHPHICALYDVGHQDGTDYLVMEYLEGETLAERLAARGSLPLDQVLRHGVEIADALDRAHRQGIVHRDLKPGNIMLTRSGVKLLDFGLAKAVQPPSSAPSFTALPTAGASLTQEGTILGTFQYMAPEQLEGKDADARSDIFALGSVLHEMATGQKAFSGTSQASLISAIMKEEPPPISTVQPMTPPALDRVVKTCLAKDPEDRWQAAGDIAKELRWIAEGSQYLAPAPVARRVHTWLGWAVAVAFLIPLAFLVARGRRPEGIAWPIHSNLSPPEEAIFEFTGDQGAPPMLSPDGRRIVFGASARLWVRSLDSGAETPLTGTDGAQFPFWSPDGRSIGFFADSKLKKVDASGGPVAVLAEAPDSRGGAWGPDGTIVFSPNFRSGLYRVPASGGAPVAITRIDASRHSTHRWPDFLPDGRHVIYLAANHADPHSEQAGIYIASLDGKENRLLLRTYGSAQVAPGWILTVRDATLMAQPFDDRRIALSGEPVRVADRVGYDFGIWRGIFTVSDNGVLAYVSGAAEPRGQLTWFDRSGKVLGTVGERSDAFWPQLSPDGGRAAVSLGDPGADVWIYELDRGVRTRATRGAMVVSEPVWSPEGAEIAYSVRPTPSDFVISVVRTDGSANPRVIMTSKAGESARIDPSSWSPDRRYLLIQKGPLAASDIWVMPLAEPQEAFPLLQTPYIERAGQFSPDGRWVAYSSRESGRDEIYVTPFPSGGARVQVSVAGGSQPRWRRDGREIYFLSADSQIVAAGVDGSGDRFHVNATRPLFRVNVFSGPNPRHAYDVAPDGRRFLVVDAGERKSPPLVLVANWEAALPK